MVLSLCFLFLFLSLNLLSGYILNDAHIDSKVPWSSSLSKAELLRALLKFTVAVSLLLHDFSRSAFLFSQFVNLALALAILHQRLTFYYFNRRVVFSVQIASEAFFVGFSVAFCIIRFLDNRIKILPLVLACLVVSQFVFLQIVALQGRHNVSNFGKIFFETDEVKIEQLILLIYKYIKLVDLGQLDTAMFLGLIS